MEAKTAVIDRIEKGIAIIIPDDGSALFKASLPDGFFEGQTVVVDKNGNIRAADDTEIPKRDNKEKLNKLFNKNKKEQR